ncbi:MAG: LysR substrate-binding domain-containing protein [Rhodospirillaceae bacterium]|nr:LysR substrate-binding domain-containing protein [Rhodospirillaceae bacterium]
MIVQAAIKGLGVTVASPSMFPGEIERGVLVPLLDGNAEIPMQWCLLTTGDARDRTAIRDFQAWILQHAAAR